MADPEELDKMVHLVAELREHIAQEEEERQRNPEAWLAQLDIKTQQQRALQECIRKEREAREEQEHTAPHPCGDRGTVLEAHAPALDLLPYHGAHAAMPARFARQDAARPSSARVRKAPHPPRHGRRDRLEALEASLRLLHTKVDALLVYLERQAHAVQPAEVQR